MFLLYVIFDHKHLNSLCHNLNTFVGTSITRTVGKIELYIIYLFDCFHMILVKRLLTFDFGEEVVETVPFVVGVVAEETET